MPPSSPRTEAGTVRQDSKEREILVAQVRLLYANANLGASVTLLAATLLAVLQWGTVPKYVILGWWLYMILVSVGRCAIAWRYRQFSPGWKEIDRWRVAFSISVGLAGAGWGSAGILLYSANHPANQIFLVFVLGGMMLGAASVQAARPEAFLAFLLLTSLPVVVRLLVQGDETHFAMAFLAAVFTAATVITTIRIYRTVEWSLCLQFENRDLLGDLKAAKQETDELNQALESKIEERTADLLRSTEQLRAETAHREAFARQKLETIGTLASGIAHDFNNLLGGVLAQADLALSELDAGSSPKEELRAIRDVAIRGSEIVRELMIYAGKENETVGPINVSRIVMEMVELLKVSVSKRVGLQTDLGTDVPPVLANAGQLRRIVMNLVTNASEAIGDRDGVIRVTTSGVTVGGSPSDRPREAFPESKYVQLEVSDTGCGMSPEMQGRIFDPFFTTKSAGHGLGLAVVDGIVRGLHGAIHVASEPEKGTTVRILLPRAESTAGPTNDDLERQGESTAPFQRATVLVVEDELPLRSAVTKMLRKNGFEVFEAADGSSAIDLLHANSDKIDLLLLDMTIPGSPSRDVVAEATKRKADIRVILTSAYTEEVVANGMSAPQIRSFLRKPVSLADLLHTIQNVLT
jgi:signal transduction histidine kinase/CheY-like chemotaxis protein